jgi:cell division protein ZapD
LNTILEALHVIHRPDLKAKLVKALTNQARILANLEKSPDINHKKLATILHHLDCLIDSLHTAHQKIGQKLYENEFLRSIYQYLTVPGGACHFNTPDYQLWLEQPPEVRKAHLLDWFETFAQLEEIVSLLLQLTRDSTVAHPNIAEQGFYQQSLDPKIPGQMVQVVVPVSLGVYPEISVGRHRLSVHFYTPHFNDQGRTDKSTDKIPFHLAYCAF